MKEITLQIRYHVFDDHGTLPEQDRDLLSAARSAIEKAYAPYSGYRVGAAVRLENGKIITGNNQENASFPSGLCAERVALFYASAQYPDASVSAIAVTVKSAILDLPEPVTPCGACRQVFAEMEKRQDVPLRIILSGDQGKVYVLEGVNNLLPLTFSADKLKKPDDGAHFHKDL